jgi:hypothetical protein
MQKEWATVDVKNDIKSRNFLKSVNVKGATKVTWDTTSSTIQVVLPESYTDSILSLDLTYHDGAKLLLHMPDAYNSEYKTSFKFRGARPHEFIVHKPAAESSSGKSYQVYVEHQGNVKAELLSPLEMQAALRESGSSIYAKIRLLSGVGTIPERPNDEKTLIGGLVDPTGNIRIQGSGYAGHLDFPNTLSFRTLPKLTLSLTYGEKVFTFPDTHQPVRSGVRARITTIFPLMKKKDIEVDGGYFIDGINYRVRLQNDFVKEPIWLTAKVKAPSLLTFEIPEGVAKGDYLFEVYEAETLLYMSNFLVSENQEEIKGIGRIWTEALEFPSQVIFNINPEKVSLNKGKVFYADPKPWMLGERYGTNSKMPDLELKRSSEMIIISAKTRVDVSYGDGGVPLYYCEYTLPADMLSGNYEARMIYENGMRSAPLWTLIKVN